MSIALPACPHLPPLRAGLNWQVLHRFRNDERGAEFYFSCLEYGQSLWCQGFAARSLLCLDRAFGADLRGTEPILARCPLPYVAMAWLIRHTPPDVFLGNPRVHFQHYADRLKDPRGDQRRWRAWGCWALARVVRPDLAGDPKHVVDEPSLARIEAELRAHGCAGEAGLWQAAMAEAVTMRVH